MEVKSFGRIQLWLMRVLWNRRKATAREITDDLKITLQISHSTVQTLLRGLEKKGAVHHQHKGRTFLYFPLINEISFKKAATRALIDRVYAGRASNLISYLISKGGLSSTELGNIRKIIKGRSKLKQK